MLGVSIGLCNWLMATTLIASGRPKATLSTTVPEAAINVGLNLLLIPRWGILGAALASALSRAAVNPVFLFLLKKDRVNTMGSYFRSFICLGLACLVLFMPGTFGFWREGTALMVFLLLVALMKALHVSDIRAILGLLTPSRHEPVSPMGYTTEP
jgi:O-antigen/teichoic acid export membrane protein